MYYVLESLFLVGGGIILLAGLWLLANLFRTNKQWLFPFLLGMIGLVVVLSPVMYTRIVSSVDLGERERVVDGELHLTLNGWNREGYEFLSLKRDVAVLQMANPDVTDETLALLKGQAKLKSLDVGGSLVTDRGLTHLVELKTLQTLRLNSTKITDAGLRPLLEALPALKQLDVRETQISSELVDAWKAEKPGRRLQK